MATRNQSKANMNEKNLLNKLLRYISQTKGSQWAKNRSERSGLTLNLGDFNLSLSRKGTHTGGYGYYLDVIEKKKAESKVLVSYEGNSYDEGKPIAEAYDQVSKRHEKYTAKQKSSERSSALRRLEKLVS